MTFLLPSSMWKVSSVGEGWGFGLFACAVFHPPVLGVAGEGLEVVPAPDFHGVG